MVRRVGGQRAKSRHKLQKRARWRGKTKVTRLLASFQIGDRVLFDIEPAVHKGMPWPRYHGLTGVVVGQRGRAYLIDIFDGNKKKQIISAPVHLRRVE